MYDDICLSLTPAHASDSRLRPFPAPFAMAIMKAPPARAYAPPDHAQSMRLRRRQATKAPARRDRPRSPYPHQSLRRKRSMTRLYRALSRSKVGGYEVIRMMKYDSEPSYDRTACPPSYLIFLEITNSGIAVSRKKCSAEEIFCACATACHGSMASTFAVA